MVKIDGTHSKAQTISLGAASEDAPHTICDNIHTVKDEVFVKETFKAIDRSEENVVEVSTSRETSRDIDLLKEQSDSVSNCSTTVFEKTRRSARGMRATTQASQSTPSANPAMTLIKSTALQKAKLKDGSSRIKRMLRTYQDKSQRHEFIEIPLELYNALKVRGGKR